MTRYIPVDTEEICGRYTDGERTNTVSLVAVSFEDYFDKKSTTFLEDPSLINGEIGNEYEYSRHEVEQIRRGWILPRTSEQKKDYLLSKLLRECLEKGYDTILIDEGYAKDLESGDMEMQGRFLRLDITHILNMNGETEAQLPIQEYDTLSEIITIYCVDEGDN